MNVAKIDYEYETSEERVDSRRKADVEPGLTFDFKRPQALTFPRPDFVTPSLVTRHWG